MEKLKRQLCQIGYNIKELPVEVLKMSLKNGYSIINNHFMAYVDNTKTGYIDHWFYV